ncbi:MAG: WecB/TagA/CpsF family glycosyltransferase, partial [Acidimicrobiia bacterium]|nr:WecB/TagA/CpsF family glycosyltransferase [Acidimicrobiia bacterium]
MTSARVTLYGIDVDAVTVDETLAWVAGMIAGGQRGKVVTLNTTGLMLAERQPFFRRFVAEADLVVADGQPLVWLSPLFGRRLPARVAGIDLIERLAAQAARSHHSLYLLGAEPDTVATAAAELQARHPGLEIAGTHHGFLGDGASEVACAIGESGAAILLVGMGSPRQEQFID